MSSLTNGDDADNFFYGNQDNQPSDYQAPLPLSNASKHDHGINPAYTLSWNDGSKTRVTGGGKMYQGNYQLDKSIDFVISAVVPDMAHLFYGAGLTCANDTANPNHIIIIDWKDMGVPALPLNFWVDLIKDLGRIKPQHLHVQCAGGNGRTGTTLAIILQLATGGYPDVATLVTSLRAGYRKAAVETKSQFDYIGYVCDIPVGDISKMIRKEVSVVKPAAKPASKSKAPPLLGLGGGTNVGSSGTTSHQSYKLSPEDEATRTSPEFMAFDKFTSNLPVETAIAYFGIWKDIGEPAMIKKGSFPYVAKVPASRVYPEFVKAYNKDEQGNCLVVNMAHIKGKEN